MPDETDATPVKVKVCGLTRVDEARAAALAGADWIGLNFYPKSPRFVRRDEAAAIVAALPEGCEPVGLFVDADLAVIRATASRLGISLVQLHGHEPPEFVAGLKAAGLRVVRAFRLGDDAAFEAMLAYIRRCAELGNVPNFLLADAYAPGQAGGTGLSIAGDLLDRLADWPAEWPPLILAGGLTPANVAERVARVRPWMVDVASGVESAPGRKDAAKVAEFIAAIRTHPDRPA